MATPRRMRKRLGFTGEDIACEYLTQHGYSVVDRNWRAGHLELDVVARREDVAHVVEVKTRRPSQSLALPEIVSFRQEQRLMEAADAYAREHEWVTAIQIDVLLIVMEPQGDYTVEYIADAIAPAF